MTITTMTEAIEYVKNALGEFTDDFDVEAIAEEATEWIDGKLTINEDGFWAIVEKHDRTAK